MPTVKYICSQCKDLFDLPAPHGPEEEKEAKCPVCGSRDVERLMVCRLETGPPPWEYKCHQCQTQFAVPVPRGPAEERAIKCPECGSKDIERLIITSEVCPPGG